MYEVRLSGSYYDMGIKRGKWASEMNATRRKFLTRWFTQNKGSFDNSLIINALKNHEEKMCTHDYDKKAKVNYGICWS